jgi:hypothetical protein
MSYSSIGEGLETVFSLIIGFAFVIGIVITLMIVGLTNSDELVVKKPLTPEIRLATDGKKIDTLYVYKLK